jgi:hypothetical protein
MTEYFHTYRTRIYDTVRRKHNKCKLSLSIVRTMKSSGFFRRCCVLKKVVKQPLNTLFGFEHFEYILKCISSARNPRHILNSVLRISGMCNFYVNVSLHTFSEQPELRLECTVTRIRNTIITCIPKLRMEGPRFQIPNSYSQNKFL